MSYVAMVVQFLHILAGIAWFGSSIFILFIVIPALRRMSASGTEEYLRALQVRSRVFFPVAGVATVLLGITRGLLFGISLGTAYGITYVGAAALGVGVLMYGALVTGPNVRRTVEAAPGADKLAALDRTTRFGYIEFTGFLILLALMIAMHFGY